jgi:hypothetical protein
VVLFETHDCAATLRCRFLWRNYAYSLTDNAQAFVLIIHLDFVTVEDRDRWLEGFRSLAAYCEKHEAGTIGYDAAIADNNELKVLVYER